MRLALGLAGLCALGCGSQFNAEPNADPDSASWAQRGLALSGAQLDRDHTGALALVTVTREQVELCTATLLTPNLAATARHCVAPTSTDSVICSEDPGSFSAPYAADSLWVNHASELEDSLASYGLLSVTGGSDEFVPVDRVYVPDTRDVCGGDLALLLLGVELDERDAAPLAPRLDAPAERGEPYTAVGFGDTPSPSGQGARRSRAGLEIACTPEDCEAGNGVEATEFRGGDGVCSGDSGGPALDAAGRVLGIASRSDDCSGSVYSAVSAWRDFIREVAARAVRAGDYAAPDWLSAPPPVPVPVPEEAPSSAPAPAEPSPPPEAESAPADAAEVAPLPVASSAGGGGSGCSVFGVERRPAPLASMLGLCLALLLLVSRLRSSNRGPTRAGSPAAARVRPSRAVL